MIKQKKYSMADFVGIASSSICLVHCIATPLLIAFGVSFFTEPIVTYLFLIISFLSIYKATKHTSHYRIAFFLWISFWGFLFSTLFYERYEWLHYVAYAFSFLIIVGHLLNIKHCKNCKIENK